MIRHFALFFLFALFFQAHAGPVALRDDYFTQGCGGDRQGAYYLPVVANDGSVAVIAPSPASTYVPNTPQRCGYLLSADAKPSVKQIFAPGYGEMMGIFFYRAATSLSADAARENFWGVSWDVIGSDRISPSIHHFALSEGAESRKDTEIAYSGELILRLQPTANGSVAFLHAVDDTEKPLTETGLYSLDHANASLQQSIDLPYDLGFAPAFTSDGNAIYYIGDNAETSTDTQKMLALYRYDLQDASAELVENIGWRTSLKVWEGSYKKSAPMIAVNSDGSAVAYRWANGEIGGVHLRVARRDARTGNYTFLFISRNSGAEGALLEDRATDNSNQLDCQYPAISANGRYVAFTAKTTGDTVRQAWRYDCQEQTLERLSDGLAGDSHAVALSPNGRYAAFVADTGELPQLYRVDCGVALTLPQKTLLTFPGTAVELNLTAIANDTATLMVDGDIPGKLLTADGVAVVAGKAYSVKTLPWTFTATKETAQATVRLTLTEGDNMTSVELSLIVSNFANLTNSVLKENAYYSYSFTDIHFSSDGRTAVFLTDAPLSSNDTDAHTQDVYRLDTSSGALDLLTGGDDFPYNVAAPQISGNGKIVYWVYEGTLWAANAGALLEGVDALTPAVSHNGECIVVRTNGWLMRSVDSGATWTKLSVEGVSSAATCTAPLTSYDGAIVAFGVRDGGALSLYVQDGSGEVRLLNEEIGSLEGVVQDGSKVLVKCTDGAFAWISVGDGRTEVVSKLPTEARELSLAANGRFLAFVAPTSSRPEVDGLYVANLQSLEVAEVAEGADAGAAQPTLSPNGRLLLFASAATNLISGLRDENEECDLFLWRNPKWSNALPGFTQTFHGNLLEDPETPYLLSLGLNDNDGDALVPALDTSGTQGTAILVPPKPGQLKYQLSYMPPQDFVGTDTVRIRSWDGTGWGAWGTLSLEVLNVNDAPVWDADTPSELSLAAGNSLQVTLHATDVDEQNPVPDVLGYSLGEAAPEWATLEEATGVLTLRPDLMAEGEYLLVARVSDGIEVIPHTIAVSVTAVAEVEVPLAFLREEGAEWPEAVEPASALGKWLGAFAVCWVNVGEGWQALSLPGDADIAALCDVLGCSHIWIYTAVGFHSVCEGTLSAGTGFWAQVVWTDEAKAKAVRILPVSARSAELPRFCGPLVGEETPAVRLQAVEDGVWTEAPAWNIGRGYFR